MSETWASPLWVHHGAADPSVRGGAEPSDSFGESVALRNQVLRHCTCRSAVSVVILQTASSLLFGVHCQLPSRLVPVVS